MECSSGKHPVFVENVKLVKFPEVIVPSTVRLQGINEGYQCGLHSLYFSGGFGFVLGMSLANRKVGRFARRTPTNLNQLPSQVVEGGTQVVNGVPDDRGDDFRDLLSDLDPVDLLCGLRIELDPVSVWVSGTERLPCGIEITDVVFGPLDFRPDGE
jgi:hypothetical protein